MSRIVLLDNIEPDVMTLPIFSIDTERRTMKAFDWRKISGFSWNGHWLWTNLHQRFFFGTCLMMSFCVQKNLHFEKLETCYWTLKWTLGVKNDSFKFASVQRLRHSTHQAWLAMSVEHKTSNSLNLKVLIKL